MSNYSTIEVGWHKSPRFKYHPGFILLYLGGVSIWMAYKFSFLLHIPCPVKILLHLPCISCGSGRSIQALMQGQFTTAIKYNPLFTMTIFVGFILGFTAIFQILTRLRIRISLPNPLPHFYTQVAITLFLMNYIYLIWFKI